ncbi:MAG: glycoside hydrolase family 57 protein [Bacteroidia bacterium]|nr:glycoside hydrolase family 57 protein [Bacteroidia bacterium]
MPSVCLYFQVHQPYRLRPQSVFHIGSHHKYWNKRLNQSVLNRVVEHCYLPANEVILSQIQKHEGRFRVAYSLSGVLIEQLENQHPAVLDSFRRLADTGCVEFLAETYYHSLSFLYQREEFLRQVLLHRDKIKSFFGQEPRVFRNTELIYQNHLAFFVSQMGYAGILAEGTQEGLYGRSPNYLYHPTHLEKTKLLLRNYALSDDVSFRFGDRKWIHFPLHTDVYAGWIASQHGEVVCIGMDYETFGEHHKESSGILKFLEALPKAVLQTGGIDFQTPSQIFEKYATHGVYDASRFQSWAGTDKDITPWLGNEMQEEAMQKIYALGAIVREKNSPELTREWSLLQTSDHFYYMATKTGAEANVHAHFSPWKSPYDAYICFMSALADFQIKLRKA